MGWGGGMNEIQTVKLNAEEQALFDTICWDLDELGRRDDRIDHLEKMGELAESLLERKAIPEVRLAYFTDPEMNVGGYGKSRKQVFEKNGTSGRDICATRTSWTTCGTSSMVPTYRRTPSGDSVRSSRRTVEPRAWYSVRSRRSSEKKCRTGG